MVSILLLAGSVILYMVLKVNDPVSAIFPNGILFTIAALSLVLLIQSLRAADSGRETFNFHLKTVVITVLIISVYMYLLNVIGFYSSSFVLFLVFPFLWNGISSVSEAVKRMVLSGAFVTVLYILFTKVLKASIPSGILF
jgi:hypothetical protein